MESIHWAKLKFVWKIKFPFQKSGRWRGLQLRKENSENLEIFGSRDLDLNQMLLNNSLSYFVLFAGSNILQILLIPGVRTFSQTQASITNTQFRLLQKRHEKVTLKSIVNPDGTKKESPHEPRWKASWNSNLTDLERNFRYRMRRFWFLEGRSWRSIWSRVS